MLRLSSSIDGKPGGIPNRAIAHIREPLGYDRPVPASPGDALALRAPGRNGALDGLRGCAALSVLVFHSRGAARGLFRHAELDLHRASDAAPGPPRPRAGSAGVDILRRPAEHQSTGGCARR